MSVDRRLSWLFGIAVSAAILVILYQRLDLAALAAVFAQTNPGWLLGTVALIVPLTVLRAIRFYWIAPAGALSGYREALRLTLVASAINVFVPAKAGDLVKSFFVSRQGGSPAGLSIAVVVYERLLDLFGMLIWCLAAAAIWRVAVFKLPAVSWGILAGAAFASGTLVLSGWSARALSWLVAGRDTHRGRLRQKLADLAMGWPTLHEQLAGRRAALALLSAGLWLLQLTQVWLFAVVLGIHVPFAAGISIAAVALMAGQLPFTFGGLGTRDLVLVALLSNWGTREAAAAVGVMTATRNFLPPLAGLPILRPYLTQLAEAGRGLLATRRTP